MNRRLAVAPLLVACGLAAAPTAPMAATDSDAVADEIRNGTAALEVRTRLEVVDDDNPSLSDDATALTARLRLSYRTGTWQRLQAFAEFDHVFHLVRDFNSGAGTRPGRSGYAVVADPEGSDLNQLYVDVDIDADWQLRIGRQRILLDNQRHVGGVGWRQNEQTYDALTVTTTAIGDSDIRYSFVNAVHRIFGDTVDAGRESSAHHLFNARIPVTEHWLLVPYVYALDYAEPGSVSGSTLTVGVRASGQVQAGAQRIRLAAEFARQSDAADNPVDYDANYWHAAASWQASERVSLGLGFESLGGDNGRPGAAFRTPLATLHKFQGWADRFLATPPAGVDDLYIDLSLQLAPWTVTAGYHDLSPADGGGDFGRELDLAASRKFGERYALLAKAALFDADAAGFDDTAKFWLQFSASY